MSEEKRGLVLQAPMSDDDILRHTQRVRKAFVDELTGDGIPQDFKDRTLLLSALNDMDRTAIGNKRIGAAEQQAEADRLAAMAIGKLTQHFGQNNPYERDVIDVDPEDINHIELPEVELVPGETDIGLSDMTYEEFARKMEAED